MCMAIDDRGGGDAGADAETVGGTDRERVETRERRETTKTVTDEYVTLTRRVVRIDPSADD